MENETNTLTYDQETELAEIFRPNADTGLAINKLRSFLKKPEVQEIANNDLRLCLFNNEVNADYLIKTRLKVINESIQNKQYKDTNYALDRLENLAGFGQKVKITQTNITKNSNLVDNYNNAQKETKKISVESND